jgi:hypothetical protein
MHRSRTGILCPRFDDTGAWFGRGELQSSDTKAWFAAGEEGMASACATGEEGWPLRAPPREKWGWQEGPTFAREERPSSARVAAWEEGPASARRRGKRRDRHPRAAAGRGKAGQRSHRRGEGQTSACGGRPEGIQIVFCFTVWGVVGCLGVRQTLVGGSIAGGAAVRVGVGPTGTGAGMVG